MVVDCRCMLLVSFVVFLFVGCLLLMCSLCVGCCLLVVCRLMFDVCCLIIVVCFFMFVLVIP